MTLVAIFLALIFAYALLSGRVERSPLTAPMLFTLAGMAASQLLAPEQRTPQAREVFLHAAEIGLTLLLFTDASRTNLSLLAHIVGLPARLLTVGMLLTMALGAFAAHWIFPALSLWQAGILAAILAPTDAGLGQVVVTSEKVPAPVREALNVEAGLNDGLAVPFLLFFIAMAAGGEEAQGAELARFVVEQLGYAVVIGLAIGGVGGALMGAAVRRGAVTKSWMPLGVLAIPLLCVLASDRFGASMFIAAFVAGLAVQIRYREAGRHAVEFTEEWGQLVNLSIFFVFGLVAAQSWHDLGARHLLYAVLSLTVIRMVPVAIALLGAKQRPATVLFMGWFGPRGLASIVLGVVYLEDVAHSTGAETIRLTVIATVLLSILAHGLSAKPGIALYARRMEAA